MTTAVLLATYNGQDYITELLTSLFAQTCQDFTIYVHDDGSKDATLEIINKFADAKPGRIVVLTGPNTGSAKMNFLWMLTAVNADNYLLCDQDDVWANDKISKDLKALEELRKENPELPACVFSDMYVTDEKLNVISESFINYLGRSINNIAYSQILIDNPAAGCTMCFNREMRDLVNDATPWMNLENIPMHDALILVLAALFGKIKAIDEPLVYYRQTGHNTMGASTESESDKVARNAADMVKGGFFERKKAFIMESRLFAAELCKIHWLSDHRREIMLRFVHMDEVSKSKRIKFYKKHNFTRAHHNFWMRLFI